VLHLDVSAGGASLVVAMALGLLILTAVGSLVFTVSALVSAPQIVAWDRLGQPTVGLPEAEATEAVVPEAEVTDVTDAAATAAAAIDAEVTSAPAPEPPSLAESLPATAWGGPPAAAPSAWAVAAATPPRFRWVTVPMRLTIGALWLIAIAMFIGGQPV
jgi:hypothetical protein